MKLSEQDVQEAFDNVNEKWDCTLRCKSAEVHGSTTKIVVACDIEDETRVKQFGFNAKQVERGSWLKAIRSHFTSEKRDVKKMEKLSPYGRARKEAEEVNRNS